MSIELTALKKNFPDLKIKEIAAFTNFNEILDGRVKTLHPLIHAGILANKENPSHLKQLKQLGISSIDLVVINLYPFEKISTKKKSSRTECIENIDIGGPSMISICAATGSAVLQADMNTANNRRGVMYFIDLFSPERMSLVYLCVGLRQRFAGLYPRRQ